eukprot:TRINITY_DN2005_c0_g1_i3.p1 TRINITY_DN2005_c0_g1~~TRINITY_DN2005_c0_g1_i3.p1  ORF type:complete len:112 (+),score=30.57 TRINITY_DN2005_c0_g1_i3:68-403(+)
MNDKKQNIDSITEALFEEILEEIYFETAIQLHKSVKLNLNCLNCEINPFKNKTANKTGNKTDIYGNNEHFQPEQIQCLKCSLMIAPTRFMQHLEKCLKDTRKTRAKKKFNF